MNRGERSEGEDTKRRVVFYGALTRLKGYRLEEWML